MQTHRVVTLTLNPALDLSAETDKVEPLAKLRCHAPRRDPGGGGINAARVIRRLGGEVTAVFPEGGYSGALLESLVTGEGVAHVTIKTAEETREDVTVLERMSGQQYRFVLPGAALTADELAACLDAVERAPGDLVIASGSLPPGVPDTVYGDLAERLSARKRRLLVDSSGAALTAALDRGVWLIKPNANELAALAGKTLACEADYVAAARAIVERGKVAHVALSLGDAGARLIGRDGAWAATAPRIKPVSTVGAGDSFLGGLTWALAEDMPLSEALRYGVAAGTAALLSPGTGLAHARDVLALYEKIAVEAI